MGKPAGWKMGKRLKPVDKPLNRAKHSLNPHRKVSDEKKGIANPRDRATIKRLKMYKSGKPKRDSAGKIVCPAPFQNVLPSGSVARVEPNPKWFSNTRVVTQSALQKFQQELGKVQKDSYQVVLRPTKLPVSLLTEKPKKKRSHILETESYETVFGPKKLRKRPTLSASSLEDIVSRAEELSDRYDEDKDRDRINNDPNLVKDLTREPIMRAGQSKRIWNELYKVIDSSDVVIQVLDARDPLGTRSPAIEKFLKEEKPHKHLVLVLNKCDLIPTSVTRKWVKILSEEYPTLAFHSSLRNSYGKGALINLLRQLKKLHEDKKQISIGFVGYPNTGKSSLINTLRAKKVCKTAPIAGETKVWQYVTLMKQIYLIDCPGVVHPHNESDTEKVLKGVVRVELVDTPEQYIVDVLDRVKKEHVARTYELEDFVDADDFLEQLARKSGKLLKKGEPDMNTVAKMVLNDWQRGKLPYFVPPPGWKQEDENNMYDEPLEDEAVVLEEGEDVEDDETTVSRANSAFGEDTVSQDSSRIASPILELETESVLTSSGVFQVSNASS
ncbi:unnamed protein product [Notodromas monacha]|uniref:Nucleolar GTP-binding protein 2 n=1 Tax=Notodromas monacha TaxID=399045 RepID=A0A7R9BFC2_9CRUS|nr:unnamed protein product [Notodromas monacha]CAG0912790.1 unnamed protein product [Notodromas monacha]